MFSDLKNNKKIVELYVKYKSKEYTTECQINYQRAIFWQYIFPILHERIIK